MDTAGRNIQSFRHKEIDWDKYFWYCSCTGRIVLGLDIVMSMELKPRNNEHRPIRDETDYSQPLDLGDRYIQKGENDAVSLMRCQAEKREAWRNLSRPIDKETNAEDRGGPN